MNPFDNCLNKIAQAKKSHFWIFFAVLLILTCLTIYSHPTPIGHDFFFHRMRFDALMEALKDGRYPVYLDYTAVNEYGYLTNVFYCDLLLLPFAFVGIYTNTLFAYQTMLFTITMLTGIITYYSINKIFKNSFVAFISAILYTFAYYRLLDMYTRAALGETLSFTFVPLVFLGLYYIIKGNYKKWYVIAIGFSLMIFSHVISSVLMFMTVIIILIICYKPLLKEPKRLLYLCLAGAVTLIIVAYYLYPMIEQTLSDTFYYETKPITGFHNNTKGFYQIMEGLFSGFIYQNNIFLPGIGFTLTFLIGIRIFLRKKSINLKLVDIGVIIGIFFIFMSSFLFPWYIFPFNKLSFIQYPWRLYEFTTFFFAIAGAYYISQIATTKRKLILGGCFVLLCTVIMINSNGRSFTKAVENVNINLQSDIHNYYLLQGAEYLPAQFPSIWYAEVRGNLIDSENIDTKISNQKLVKGITSFNVSISKPDTLQLPLLYYKGYFATLNNREIPVKESRVGLVEIPINESGDIKVMYSGTFIQKISPYITLISLIGLCLYIIINNRRKKNEQSI